MLKIENIESIKEQQRILPNFREPDQLPKMNTKIMALCSKLMWIDKKLKDEDVRYHIILTPTITDQNSVTDVAVEFKHNDVTLYSHRSVSAPFYQLANVIGYEAPDSPLIGDPDFSVISKINLNENTELFMKVIENKILNAYVMQENKFRIINNRVRLQDWFSNQFRILHDSSVSKPKI
jgi:hypothetical protein